MKERDIQILAESYLDILGMLYVRVPDSLWAFVKKSMNFRLLGLCSKFLSGMPDLVIFGFDENGNSKVLLIEIKTQKGILLDSQKKWHTKTKVHVCRSFEEIKDLVDFFIK